LIKDDQQTDIQLSRRQSGPLRGAASLFALGAPVVSREKSAANSRLRTSAFNGGERLFAPVDQRFAAMDRVGLVRQQAVRRVQDKGRRDPERRLRAFHPGDQQAVG